MNKFEIFTKQDYSFIPANTIIVKNKHGWMYMMSVDTQWYTNSTPDQKNCPPEENEKFLKKLVKAIKEQLKLV